MPLTTSVVHLIWLPYGIKLFTDFVDSYRSFSAGYTHQLILLFNGISDEKEADDYHLYIQQYNIKYQTFYYKTGQDLEAYRWVASRLSSAYVLFLNSYSRFLTDNWLQKFVTAQQDTNAGIIGSTGSWQSYYSSIFKINKWRWTKAFTLNENVRKYKLMLKALFLWRWYFKSFPNFHVRTNGFFISRKVFLGIKYKNPKTKFDAYRLESGKRSITRQVLAKGLKVVIIDKFGETFEHSVWNAAKVFWCDEQQNLLISDNQTELYISADFQYKILLSTLAWGKL